MDRRLYCSRCLTTFAGPGPDACPAPTCRRQRPPRDWPAFLDSGDVVDDRYVVQSILGAGGAGVTYRCLDLLDDEQTAVKILHEDRKRGTLANRLAIEGEVLELLDHPHIVPFRALKLHGDGHFYLATLHMPGGSLDSWVRRHGKLDPEGVVTAGRQLAMALDYVHAGGIVHRDIKPANVLLEMGHSTRPVVRLADFGIARLFREQRPVAGLTRTGAFIGTPEYAAPEQVRGEKGVGPAADAFALGALLHYLACGTSLNRREDIDDWKAFRERDWQPASRPRLADSVPCDRPEGRDALRLLDKLIDGLMDADPSRRLDMGTAAMRLGANPAQLAPADQPRFAPPTLASSAEGDLFDEDMEALVPAEEIVEPALSAAARGDTGSPGTSPAAGLREASPTAITIGMHETRSDGPNPAREKLAGRPPAPGLDLLPEVEVPTRDASEEWEEADLAWPTRQARRNRLHGAAVVVASLAAGLVLAWPGGPSGLVGWKPVTSGGGVVGMVGEALRVEPTAYEPRDAGVAPGPPAAPVEEPGRADVPPREQRPRTGSGDDGSTAKARKRTEGPRAVPSTPRPVPTPAERPEPEGRAAPGTATPGNPAGHRAVPAQESRPATVALAVPAIAGEDAGPAPAAGRSRDDTARSLGTDLGHHPEPITPGEPRDDDAAAFDERGERFGADAEAARARVAEARSRWEQAQREARRQQAPSEPSVVAGQVEWQPWGDLGVIEALFGRDPRTRPRGRD